MASQIRKLTAALRRNDGKPSVSLFGGSLIFSSLFAHRFSLEGVFRSFYQHVEIFLGELGGNMPISYGFHAVSRVVIAFRRPFCGLI
jgi:hypothetical protein